MVVFGQKWLCSGKLIVFGIKWLYSGKRGCIRQSVCFGEKVAVFGKRWLFSSKVVVFGQKWLYSGKSGCIRAKLFYSGKIVCIRAKCFCSGKMLVIGEGGCIWPNMVVAFVALLHLYKVVLFGQSCCIKAKVFGFGQTWLYSGNVVVFR